MITKEISWINRKDKLPEKDGQYLCIKNISQLNYMSVLNFTTKEINSEIPAYSFYEQMSDGDLINLDREVVYWAEMPEKSDIYECSF